MGRVGGGLAKEPLGEKRPASLPAGAFWGERPGDPGDRYMEFWNLVFPQFDAQVDGSLIPLARPGFVTAAILSFAHTVGEFGVVLMIGGNIPERTRVVSTQIYGHVEALETTQAHGLAAAMVAFSFVVLLAINVYGRRSARVTP